MSAWAGARAGWGGFDARVLNPSVGGSFNTYDGRLSRYDLYEHYYSNTVYDSLSSVSASLKVNERLYRAIRGVYNPIKRENALYVSNVYQGQLNTKDLGEGALPLEFDNDSFEPAITNVMRWSNLGPQLSTFTHQAALLGDAFWWIVDDPERRRVRLELLHPSKVRDMEVDAVGNVKAAVIEYEREEPPDVADYRPSRSGGHEKPRKTYLYTLKVDQDEYRTFKDGEPFAYFDDINGEPLAHWPNDAGFVPLRPAYFEPTDDGWGRNSFFATRRKIDELNDQTSLINDTVRRVIEPLLKVKGVTPPTTDNQTMTAVRDDKSGLTMLYLTNVDGDIEALQIPVDLAAATDNAQKLLAEIERDMPLLALQHIREGGALTAPGVRTGYSDAIGLVESARKNLDPAVIAALQMACTIGGIRGYDGFEGFSADSFDSGDMELGIKPRPVVPDTLSKQETIAGLATVTNMSPALARVALKQMDVSDKDIEAIVADLQLQATIQPPTTLGVGNDANGSGLVPDALQARLAQGQTADAGVTA